jgi:hypothetical protein
VKILVQLEILTKLNLILTNQPQSNISQLNLLGNQFKELNLLLTNPHYINPIFNNQVQLPSNHPHIMNLLLTKLMNQFLLKVITFQVNPNQNKTILPLSNVVNPVVNLSNLSRQISNHEKRVLLDLRPHFERLDTHVISCHPKMLLVLRKTHKSFPLNIHSNLHQIIKIIKNWSVL